MNFFSGSSDSRYFICKRNRELIFSREEKILWRKTAPTGNFEIIGVGNNGFAASLEDEGIRIFPVSEKDPEEVVEKFSQQMLSAKSSYVGKAVLKDTGTQICMDIVSGKSKSPDKIFPGFGGGKGSKVMEYHEILFYSVAGKNHEIFYRFEQPKDHEGRLYWNISKDFNYMALLEPQKKTGGKKSKFSVIHTPSYEAHQEIMLKDASISQIMVNQQGFALLDLTTEGVHELFVVSPDGKRYNLTAPQEYEILHLGSYFVAMLVKSGPSLLIKSFEDAVQSQADLNDLNGLNIPYGLLFNAKDNIDLVYYVDEEIKVLHSDVDRIKVDTKRWDIIGKQATYSATPETSSAAPEERKSPVIGEIPHADMPLTDREKSRMADKSVFREEILRSLESIRVEYIMGQINEEEYKKTKERLEKDLMALEFSGGGAPAKQESEESLYPRVESSAVKDSPPTRPEPAREALLRIEPAAPKEPSAGKMEAPVAKASPPPWMDTPAVKITSPSMMEPPTPKEHGVLEEEPLQDSEVDMSEEEIADMDESSMGMGLPALELDSASPQESPARVEPLHGRETPARDEPAQESQAPLVEPVQEPQAHRVEAAKEHQAPAAKEPQATQLKQKQSEPSETALSREVTEDKRATVEEGDGGKFPEERKKLAKLLEVLEERLMVGLISETTYENLKEKYSRTLEMYKE